MRPSTPLCTSNNKTYDSGGTPACCISSQGTGDGPICTRLVLVSYLEGVDECRATCSWRWHHRAVKSVISDLGTEIGHTNNQVMRQDLRERKGVRDS